VQELLVPNAGHWLMQEAPTAAIAAVQCKTSSQHTESGGRSFAQATATTLSTDLSSLTR